MLMGSLNGELKNAAESKSLDGAFESDVTKLASGGKGFKEQMIHDALMNPEALVNSGGGPTVNNSRGVPCSGVFVNANGGLRILLGSRNMVADAARSRGLANSILA